MGLPPFPVHDDALGSLWTALHPPAELGCTSLYATLEMYSLLGGSDPTAAVDDDGVVRVLRDPQYSVGDVIDALILEIWRLRGVPDPSAPSCWNC